MDAVERECAKMLQDMVMPKSLEGRRRSSASDYFEPSRAVGQKRKAEDTDDEAERSSSSPRSLSSFEKADKLVLPGTENLRKIFISRLDPSITLADLRAFYSVYGIVTDYRIRLTPSLTASKKLVGFVDFADEQSARRALREGNGLQIKHHTMSARFAIQGPHEERDAEEDMSSRSLFVESFDGSLTESQIWDAFTRRHHHIVRLRPLPLTSRPSHRLALVEFNTAGQARAAQADMDLKYIGQCKIEVQFSRPNDGNVGLVHFPNPLPGSRPQVKWRPTFVTPRDEQRDNGYASRTGR